MTAALVLVAAIDLAQLRPFAGKGRVQDLDYHHDPLIERLILMGPDAVPLLVEAISDQRPLPTGFMCCWGGPVTVGDAAFFVLLDFFLDSKWTAPCVPGVSWDAVVGPASDAGAEVEYARFLKRVGRRALQRRMRAMWNDHRGTPVWDAHEQCFRDRATAPGSRTP